MHNCALCIRYSLNVDWCVLLHNAIPRFSAYASNHRSAQGLLVLAFQLKQRSNGMLHFNTFFMTYEANGFSYCNFDQVVCCLRLFSLIWLGFCWLAKVTGNRQKKIINKAQAYACNCSTSDQLSAHILLTSLLLNSRIELNASLFLFLYISSLLR